MKSRILLLLLICLSFISNSFSQVSLWSDLPASAIQSYVDVQRGRLPSSFRVMKLNRQVLAQLQTRTPVEIGNQLNLSASTLFAIPVPEGGLREAAITESSVLSASLQQQFPGIKTYRLSEPITRNQLGRITITAAGISGLLFSDKGSVYISPVGNEYPDVHYIYYVKDLKPADRVACLVKDEVANLQPAAPQAGDCQLRTYRLAVAATGEYTTWAGGQANAIGYITTAINDVTAIFERDLAIRFTLITNNNIVYPNAGSDPYTLNDLSTTTLNQNHTALNAQIGSGNYDIGILFNNGWNGGLAYLNSTCNATLKGGAQAGITFGTGSNPTAGPQGPIFVTTVAHEIAHKFGAQHTHSATNGGCGGGNVNAGTAWEVGGGSTIMAYAGVCEDVIENWYQPQSDHYFHSGTLAQMHNFVTAGAGLGCVIPTALVNSPPVVSIPATSYNIPISTPFTLTASGTDPDGNTLLYTWEQMNAATSSARPAATSLTRPNFRSYAPSTNPVRNFPLIDSLASGVATVFEVLPSVTRTMNFRVTARDFAAGGGCTDEENLTVTTNASAGPFIVTSQSTPVTLTADGTNTFTVTWDVANTTAAPVNTAAVDILFSTDGGLTYPYTLVTNTSNDGSEVLIVPNLRTILGRVKVQARNNIFFNINSANITINSACVAEGTTFTPSANVSAPAGAPALNLSLNPTYGSIVVPSGTISAADPVGFLAVNDAVNVGNTCIAFSNAFRYQTYSFTPSVAGNYTFQLAGGTPFGAIINLYQGNNAYVPGNPCSGFIVSNGTYQPNGAPPPTNIVAISSGFVASLTPGIRYTLAVGTFSNGTPAIPFNYTVNVTNAGGGNIYSATPSPGAGFNYTYVIVNNATGIITAIDPSADLSNPATFPGGTSYTVYGLSYSNTIPIGTLNAYIGNSFASLNNDLLNNPATRCGNLSKNSMQVSILAVTPVSFVGLKASKAPGNKVQLSWKTASEQNNDYFEVQRSADGANFSSVLGKVPGRGNSNELVQYGFTDIQPLLKWNFYRIRQVDRDGRSAFSNIVSLQFAKPGAVMQIYPNPVQNQLVLEFSSSTNQKVRVSIFDNKGAEVKRMDLNAAVGLNRSPFDVSSLSNGIYLIKTTIDGNILTDKFVKQ